LLSLLEEGLRLVPGCFGELLPFHGGRSGGVWRILGEGWGEAGGLAWIRRASATGVTSCDIHVGCR
jgi:hypothetical protein